MPVLPRSSVECTPVLEGCPDVHGDWEGMGKRCELHKEMPEWVSNPEPPCCSKDRVDDTQV